MPTLPRCNATIARDCSYLENANRGVDEGAVDLWLYAFDNEGDCQNTTCSAAACLPIAAVGTRNVPVVEHSSTDNARVNIEARLANFTDPKRDAAWGLIRPDLPD